MKSGRGSGSSDSGGHASAQRHCCSSRCRRRRSTGRGCRRTWPTQLKAPKGQTLQVIADGDAATLRDVAARYGLRVKRTLDAGAVARGHGRGVRRRRQRPRARPRRARSSRARRHGGHARVHRRPGRRRRLRRSCPASPAAASASPSSTRASTSRTRPWPAGCSWRRTSPAARRPTRWWTGSGTARTWPTSLPARPSPSTARRRSAAWRPGPSSSR